MELKVDNFTIQLHRAEETSHEEEVKRLATYVSTMPIVLVEGEKDAIAMQTIYPYTLAMGRNTLGSNIKYLKYLTDKFIIIPDNDEAGLNGYEKIKKDMDRYGLKLKRISINNPKLKDFADVYTNGNWESLRKIMTKLKAKFNIN